MTWAAVAVVVAALGGQSFWIGHVLAGLRGDIRDLRGDIRALTARLDRIEGTVLRGERIARLEERLGR